MEYSQNFTTTNDSLSEDIAYEQYLDNVLKICQKIGKYQRIIIPSIGLIGNFFSLLVFSIQVYQRRTSSGVYFISMAVADTIILFCALVFFMDMRNALPEITSVPFVCSLTYFLSHGAQFLSAWSLVALSIDRAIAVTQPFRFKKICTLRRSAMIVAFSALIGFGYCTHYFETYNVVNRRCVLKVWYADEFLMANSWIRIMLYSFLPATIMTINSIVIIYTINKNQQNVNISGESARSRTVTRLLLIVAIFFLIFSLPTSINNIFIVMSPTYRFSKIRKIITSLVPLSTSINHAANFYLYVASGAAFRAELKSVLYAIYNKRCECKCTSRIASSAKSRNHPARNLAPAPENLGTKTVSLAVLTTAAEEPDSMTSESGVYMGFDNVCYDNTGIDDVHLEVDTGHGHQSKM